MNADERSWFLKGKPHAVQMRALELSNRRKGFLHFEEQGLGKTAIVLAEYADFVNEGLIDGMVVVCPNSLKINWFKEADKWGAKYKTRIVLPEDIKSLDLNKMKPPFIITINYESIRKGTRGLEALNAIMKGRRSMVAADESINIKNPHSNQTFELMDLSKGAAFTRSMSGAPISQGPHDLWAQGRFVGLYNGIRATQFKLRYCRMGGFQGRQVVGVKEDLVEELWRTVDENGFRALKEEWTDLPEKIYALPRMITMTKEQRRMYLEMKEEFITYLDETDEGSFVEAQMTMTKLMKLHQISSGIIIDNEGLEHFIIPTEENPKMQEVLRALQETRGKVLIFTHFRLSTKAVFEYLGKRGYEPVLLEGGMKVQEVENRKEIFNDDSKCRVAVLQAQSHMYGHTLLGGKGEDRCSTSFYYEVDYNLNTRVQTEDRNHRYGQDKAVVYVDFIASEIEEIAVTALQRKKNVAKLILDTFKGR